MPVPDWADENLSNDLSVLRAKGEGQEIEYMEVFPQQVRELGKEIAAFASTNPGTILLGISDDGHLVGLSGTGTLEQRDELLRRIEGICRGTLKPAITPTIKWAVEGNINVLCIAVPKGTEPIYYSNNIPYIRHLSASRPAEPHEVVERIRNWLASQVGETSDPYQELMNQLASVVNETLIFADEAEQRNVNPWLDQWRAQFEHAAHRLREFSADEQAVRRGLHADLTDLAAALDAVASFQLYMGCETEFDAAHQHALEVLRKFKTQYVDSVPLSERSLASVKELLIKTQRQVISLTTRMEDIMNRGEIETVQSEASKLGFTLLQLAYYSIDAIQDGLSARLRKIGHDLHLLETHMIYADGGHSMQVILDQITQGAKELTDIVDSIE